MQELVQDVKEKVMTNFCLSSAFSFCLRINFASVNCFTGSLVTLHSRGGREGEGAMTVVCFSSPVLERESERISKLV